MSILTSLYQRSLCNGVLFAVLSATGFSLKAVFVKLAYAAAPVDAVTVLAIRMGLALPLFLWLIRLSRKPEQPRLSLADGVNILLLGLVGYYLSSLFDFYGLQYISAGLERLILFTYPTLVLLLQMALTREPPGSRTLAALGLCYLGLGIALVHDIRVEGSDGQIVLGAIWVFASAVTYALYYMGTASVVRRVGSMRLAGLAGGASSVMVLIHYGLTCDLQQLRALPSAVWIYGVLMALISTVLPIYWMALAIQRMGATHAAAFGNLGPVLTVFASWALLNEAISMYQLAGLALVLFGVSRLSASKASQPETEPGQKHVNSRATG
ncbi:DMT family transporter [Pseudomonas sp. QE6]|uniref:DMT family transporter n=1 Tax=Pseudomonas sp. QE6 TaxID=3242491 RepID=UPI003527CF5A